MSICEPKALAGQTIQPGSADLGIWVLATQVAIAQVVCEDENDVRQCRLIGFGTKQSQTRQTNR